MKKIYSGRAFLRERVSKKQDLRKDTAENFERTVLCNRNRIIFFIERYDVGSESVILKFLHICISIKIEDTYFAIIKAGGLFNPDEFLIMVFRLHTVTIYIYAEGCSFRNVRRGEHLIFVAVKERAGTGGKGTSSWIFWIGGIELTWKAAKYM